VCVTTQPLVTQQPSVSETLRKSNLGPGRCDFIAFLHACQQRNTCSLLAHTDTHDTHSSRAAGDTSSACKTSPRFDAPNDSPIPSFLTTIAGTWIATTRNCVRHRRLLLRLSLLEATLLAQTHVYVPSSCLVRVLVFTSRCVSQLWPKITQHPAKPAPSRLPTPEPTISRAVLAAGPRGDVNCEQRGRDVSSERMEGVHATAEDSPCRDVLERQGCFFSDGEGSMSATPTSKPSSPEGLAHLIASPEVAVAVSEERFIRDLLAAREAHKSHLGQNGDAVTAAPSVPQLIWPLRPTARGTQHERSHGEAPGSSSVASLTHQPVRYVRYRHGRSTLTAHSQFPLSARLAVPHALGNTLTVLPPRPGTLSLPPKLREGTVVRVLGETPEPQAIHSSPRAPEGSSSIRVSRRVAATGPPRATKPPTMTSTDKPKPPMSRTLRRGSRAGKSFRRRGTGPPERSLQQGDSMRAQRQRGGSQRHMVLPKLPPQLLRRATEPTIVVPSQPTPRRGLGRPAAQLPVAARSTRSTSPPVAAHRSAVDSRQAVRGDSRPLSGASHTSVPADYVTAATVWKRDVQSGDPTPKAGRHTGAGKTHDGSRRGHGLPRPFRPLQQRRPGVPRDSQKCNTTRGARKLVSALRHGDGDGAEPSGVGSGSPRPLSVSSWGLRRAGEEQLLHTPLALLAHDGARPCADSPQRAPPSRSRFRSTHLPAGGKGEGEVRDAVATVGSRAAREKELPGRLPPEFLQLEQQRRRLRDKFR